MAYYDHIFGLYFEHHRRQVTLPLTSVDVLATVKDLSATVLLTQTYRAETVYGVIEARYAFPIPARAAVASFALIKQNGERVIGKVQEKSEARKTYDTAKSQGKLAALMVQESPDVFQVNVGNISPGETVKVELCYSTELTEDEENDSIRLSLPTVIGARYGQGPVATFGVNQSSSAFLSIKANIEALAPIAKIGSPSHTIETELGPDSSVSEAQSLPFSHYARVSLTSASPLDKDFVLTLKAAGLDAPRCLAEIHPTKATVAFSLTLVPRFKLLDVPKQEFIFLVDRSGSMQGKRIETAKKALVNMIHSLPHKGTTFNIVSFGSVHKSYWLSSREYNQNTLEDARKHVDGMQADFGGTEIERALEAVFGVRQSDRPTSVFVLTDGDSWGLDATLAVVSKAVETAKPGAYLRVFTLGIGNIASTSMVEGIARRGNGSSAFVNDNESFTGKTARLLKAARAPLVRNCRIDWGVDGIPSSAVGIDSKMEEEEDFELVSSTTQDEDTSTKLDKISLFDDENDEPLVSPNAPPPPPNPMVLPKPAPIQQSPYTIISVSPATRMYVYSILSAPAWTKGDALPKSVTFRGSLGSGQEVELEVPVTQSQLLAVDTSRPLPVHTLAARKIIQDLEDGQHEFANGNLDPQTLQATEKAAIVRIAKEYSLMSKYTSFVAVDEAQRPLHASDGYNDAYQSDEAKEDESGTLYGVPMRPTILPSGGAFPSSNISPASQPSSYNGAIAMASFAPPSSRAQFCRASAPPAQPQPNPFAVFSSSPGGSSTRRRAPPPPPSAQGFRFGVSAPAAPAAAPSPPRIETDADRLDAIVRLQTFDGSFAAVASVLELCQTSLSLEQLVALLPKLTSSALGAQRDKVAVTLLVLVFFKEKLGGEKDSWEGVADKANEFVAEELRNGGVTSSVDELRAIIARSIWGL